MERGRLRVYLGAAPGVGKTFAMLDEGHRRAERGTDVVIGFVETHGRPTTEQQVGDLEVVPRRTVAYRGLSRDRDGPGRACWPGSRQLALVDELAHTNVVDPADTDANPKRWQDVQVLLDARHRRDHHGQRAAPGVAERRGASRSPGSARPRRCPTTWSGPRRRSSWWT